LLLNKLNDSNSGTTINVGTIKGGTRSNVIADYAHAEVDVRSPNTEEIDKIAHELRNMAQKPYNKEARIEVTGGVVAPPLIRTRKVGELFGIIQKIGEQMGLKLNETSTGGGSDGNFVCQYAPTIDGMGCQGSGSHSIGKEYVLTKSLVERPIIFSKFMIQWFNTFQKE
jgi:glutamate carboxypeptidase